MNEYSNRLLHPAAIGVGWTQARSIVPANKPLAVSISRTLGSSIENGIFASKRGVKSERT